MTVMHAITQTTAPALTATGGHRAPVGRSSHPQAATLPLTAVYRHTDAGFNQLLQALGQSQGQRSGSAALLSLVGALQQQLQRHVLQPRQLSDATRLRQQVLQSGLFLEVALADGAPVDTMRNDLKFQPFQIVALPESDLACASAGMMGLIPYKMPSSARGLLGNGPPIEPHPTGGQQGVGAYQQHRGTSRHSGIPDSALQFWLGQEAREALDDLRQRQARSGRYGDDNVWQLELLLLQQDGVQPPWQCVTCSCPASTSAAEPGRWRSLSVSRIERMKKRPCAVLHWIVGSRIPDAVFDALAVMLEFLRHEDERAKE